MIRKILLLLPLVIISASSIPNISSAFSPDFAASIDAKLKEVRAVYSAMPKSQRDKGYILESYVISEVGRDLFSTKLLMKGALSPLDWRRIVKSSPNISSDSGVVCIIDSSSVKSFSNQDLLAWLNDSDTANVSGALCLYKPNYKKVLEDYKENREDLQRAAAQVFCSARFGHRSVPYLKYVISPGSGKSLIDASCIKDNRDLGEGKYKLTCYNGIVEVDSPGGSIKSCIRKLPKDASTEERKRGTETSGPIASIPSIVPKTESGSSAPTVLTGSDEESTSPSPPTPRLQTPAARYSPPPTQAQQQLPPQLRRPQQPQQQRQSIWDAIKQSLGGGGARGAQQQRKIMPECSVFAALDSEIEEGQSTTLQWALEYTSSAYITPNIGLVRPTTDSIKITPSETTTYTMQLHNKNGYESCDPVTVRVVPSQEVDDDSDTSNKEPTISCSPERVSKGGKGVILWQCPRGVASATGSSTEYPNFRTGGKLSGSTELPDMQTDGKFVVRCMSDTGEELGRNSCNIEVVDTPLPTPVGNGQPTVNLAADKEEVRRGEVVNIAWRGDNTDNCRITSSVGNLEKYGNRGNIYAALYDTTTFSLICIADKTILPTKELTIVVK